MNYYTLEQTCRDAGIRIDALLELIRKGFIRVIWIGNLPRINKEQHDRVINSVHSQFL